MKARDLNYAEIIWHCIRQFVECYLPPFSDLRSPGSAPCSSDNGWTSLRRLSSAAGEWDLC